MYDSVTDIQQELQEYGELHLTLDSGATAELHLNDTTFHSGAVHIDSKAGEWKFAPDAVEGVEYPQSALHPPE